MKIPKEIFSIPLQKTLMEHEGRDEKSHQISERIEEIYDST